MLLSPAQIREPASGDMRRRVSNRTAREYRTAPLCPRLLVTDRLGRLGRKDPPHPTQRRSKTPNLCAAVVRCRPSPSSAVAVAASTSPTDPTAPTATDPPEVSACLRTTPPSSSPQVRDGRIYHFITLSCARDSVVSAFYLFGVRVFESAVFFCMACADWCGDQS